VEKETFSKQLSQIITYLEATGETDTLEILRRCSDITLEKLGVPRMEVETFRLTLYGPPEVYRRLIGENGLGFITDPLHEAARAVVAEDVHLGFVCIMPSAPDGWRTALTVVPPPEETANQGLPSHPAPLEYLGLKFGSKSEIKIAEALEHNNVLYFPNCAARINDGR
jgi:hypothetical protein